jgi:hypothetical protein
MYESAATVKWVFSGSFSFKMARVIACGLGPAKKFIKRSTLFSPPKNRLNSSGAD